MSPSRVEQTKLLANALDRASTACVTVGIATPLAGYAYNISNFRSAVAFDQLCFGVAIWFCGAVALHFLARRALRGLDR